MSDQPKRPRGRPPKPTEEKETKRIEARVSPALKERYIALGGGKWLKSQLAKARV